MSDFQLKHDAQGYEPPGTWEEVASLDRPAKLKAVRYFLREAAATLHRRAGVHPDDIVMLFDAIPGWVSSQRHAWKADQAERFNAWRCNNCTHIGSRDEFFAGPTGKQQAVCPKCGKTDAQQIFDKSAPSKTTKRYHSVPCPTPEQWEQETERVLLQEAAAAAELADRIDQKTSCSCEGHECPVCQGVGDTSIIEGHACATCGTEFCSRCHGIVKASMSRAWDSCNRCKCDDPSRRTGGRK